MKDLYARLNLSPEASPQGIRSRLKKATDSQLKRAAQEILLRPERREVYDRNHRTLQLIGELRRELDLTDSRNWQETGGDDFVAPPDPSRATSSTQGSKSSSTRTESSTNRGSNTSRNERTSAGAGSGGASAGTTRETKSSGKSFFESIAGVVSGAVRGVFGCLVSLIARLAGAAVVFGSIALLVQVCSTIDQETEPDDQVQTAQSPTGETDEPGSSLGTESQTEESPAQSTEQESFSVPAKSLPGNGTWWKYTSEELIAPLQISVSEGQHYYVKLTDAFTGETVLTMFIRSGRTIEVEVPTGKYDLKYAIGDTWYGRENLFGPSTEYMKSEDTFNFEIVGRQVQGHRVELIVQRGGNLRTNPIPESEF